MTVKYNLSCIVIRRKKVHQEICLYGCEKAEIHTLIYCIRSDVHMLIHKNLFRYIYTFVICVEKIQCVVWHTYSGGFNLITKKELDGKYVSRQELNPNVIEEKYPA